MPGNKTSVNNVYFSCYVCNNRTIKTGAEWMNHVRGYHSLTNLPPIRMRGNVIRKPTTHFKELNTQLINIISEAMNISEYDSSNNKLNQKGDVKKLGEMLDATWERSNKYDSNYNKLNQNDVVKQSDKMLCGTRKQRGIIQETLKSDNSKAQSILFCRGCRKAVNFQQCDLLSHLSQCPANQVMSLFSDYDDEVKRGDDGDKCATNSNKKDVLSNWILCDWPHVLANCRYCICEYECCFCVESFVNASEWETHIVTTHTYGNYINCGLTIFFYLCKFCDKIFYGLKNHIDDHITAKHTERNVDELRDDLNQFYSYMTELLNQPNEHMFVEKVKSKFNLESYCQVCNFFGDAVKHFSSLIHRTNSFRERSCGYKLKLCTVCQLVMYSEDIYLLEHLLSVSHIRLKFLTESWQPPNFQHIESANGHTNIMNLLTETLEESFGIPAFLKNFHQLFGYYCAVCDFTTCSFSCWDYHMKNDENHACKLNSCEEPSDLVKNYTCPVCKIRIFGLLFAFMAHCNSEQHFHVEQLIVALNEQLITNGPSNKIEKCNEDNSVVAYSIQRSHVDRIHDTSIDNELLIANVTKSVASKIEMRIEDTILTKRCCEREFNLFIGSVSINSVRLFSIQTDLITQMLANSLHISMIEECHNFICTICSFQSCSLVEWNEHISSSQRHGSCVSGFIENELSIHSILCPTCRLFVIGKLSVVILEHHAAGKCGSCSCSNLESSLDWKATVRAPETSLSYQQLDYNDVSHFLDRPLLRTQECLNSYQQ